jgi:hypothetical protein
VVINASPSEVLDQAIQDAPSSRRADRRGRPLVVPAAVIDMYGGPHHLVAAIGNSLELLLERVTARDEGSVAQIRILQFIATGCKGLATRCDKLAAEFHAEFISDGEDN